MGEPVAAVAATSRYIAEDALELIAVDYEPLEPVVDPAKAMEPESPLVIEEHGTNVMLQRVFTWGEVEEAFAEADHVFTEKFRWNRVGANPIETFGVISEWNPVEQSLTCRGSFQSPSFMALGRAASLGLPSNKVRMISHPHGGSFGGKGGARGTDITALLSRKAGGRPVKWIEDRMEYLTAGGGQAWDRHYEASLAVEAGRHRHRPQGQAARRPRRHRRGLRRRSAPPSRWPPSPAPTRSGPPSTTSPWSRPTSSRRAPTAAWARRRTTSCWSR